MNTKNIVLNNLSDLMNFRNFVRENDLRGYIVQNNFKANVRNYAYIALALPLDHASIEAVQVAHTVSNMA